PGRRVHDAQPRPRGPAAHHSDWGGEPRDPPLARRRRSARESRSAVAPAGRRAGARVLRLDSSRLETCRGRAAYEEAHEAFPFVRRARRLPSPRHLPTTRSRNPVARRRDRAGATAPPRLPADAPPPGAGRMGRAERLVEPVAPEPDRVGRCGVRGPRAAELSHLELLAERID